MLLTLAFIFGASAAWLALQIIRAPIGYEDAAGFHFGPEPTDPRAAVAQGSREGVCPSPSALPADVSASPSAGDAA